MSEFLPATGTGAAATPAAPLPLHKTRLHPPPKGRRRPVPTLFWPIVTFLLSVSVSLICWYAYSTLPPAAAAGEKHLRQAPISLKFNPTSAAAPVVDKP